MTRARTAALAVMTTIAATAWATTAVATATTKPIQIATTGSPNPPYLLADAKGATEVVWNGTNPNGSAKVEYARRAKGARKFKKIALPKLPNRTDAEPAIYQASPGTLVIVVGFAPDFYAVRSTNDGVSWSRIDTSALNALTANSEYVSSQGIGQGPHGGVEYAGNDGDTGPVIALGRNLGSTPILATMQPGIVVEQVTETASGEPFELGISGTTDEPVGDLMFQAGASTAGKIDFPCSDNKESAGSAQAIAPLKSGVVVAYSGCGRVWTRTISASGKVGKLVRVASSPTADAELSQTGSAWVGLTSHAGKVTLAYAAPGDDIGQAHSSNGTRWKVAKTLIPIATDEGNIDGYHPTLSAGSGTSLGYLSETSNFKYLLRTFDLRGGYKPVGAPSTKGLTKAKRITLGSTSLAAPTKLSLKGFRKYGKVKLRLRSALKETVTVDLEVSTLYSEDDYIDCGGEASVHLKPNHVKLVTLKCANDASATATKAAPDIKKKSVASLTFDTRNGNIALSAKF